MARLTSGREVHDTSSSSGGVSALLQAKTQVPTRTVDVSGTVICDAYTFLRSERNDIDFAAPPLHTRNPYLAPNPGCQCQSCRQSTLQKWTDNQATDLDAKAKAFAEDDDRLMLCPPRVLGYALKEKLWVQLLIKRINKVENDAETQARRYFQEELQLEDRYKDLLFELISNHKSSRIQTSGEIEYRKLTSSLDVVPGKGQGLAILLHGPPGVGKTLTAETIAMATDRPLLPVSVAEIGTDADVAEYKLTSIFADAQRWEAVLLIDEADVFLEERGKSDNPNRNALVSVLLRCLEYYQGIIILTTNRIKSIDIGVQSRMHLAIQYRDLTAKQKLKIYENLLKRIPDRKIENRAGMYKELEKICRRSAVNGRQIRNIVASALAMADSDKGTGKLTFDKIDEVHEMTKEFLDSLEIMTWTARGRNEADNLS